MCSLYEQSAVVTGREKCLKRSCQYFGAGGLVCVSNVFSKGEANLEAGEYFETL